MHTDERFILLETKTKRASIVLDLVDDYTGNRPVGRVAVSLTGRNVKPVKNKSGYYVFANLPHGEYEVTVHSNEYRAESFPVTVNPSGPAVKTLRLVPVPSYSFPRGATLFRGTVFQQPGARGAGDEDTPLTGVKVSLRLKQGVLETTTTTNGEFVIYLPRWKESKHRPSGKYFVRSNDNEIVLKAAFGKEGFKDGDMFVVEKGNRAKTDSFSLEIGQQILIRKYMVKEGGA